MNNLGYDLFDINSDFYQDICTPYKSPNGTDVPLNDRINYYFNNDETQCQPNCKFSDYSSESEYLKCECDIQTSEMNFENKNEIGSKSIYKSFYDILKYSNYKVLKCYKLAFSSKIFRNNKGNIIVLIYFGIYFIFLLIYFIKGASELKNDISNNLINNNRKDINKEKINFININNENKPKININPKKDLNNISQKNNKISKKIIIMVN